MSIYFNTESSCYDSLEEKPITKPVNSRPMPSSDAIWVEIPAHHYRSIQPKQELKEYNPQPYVSLVAKGDYK